VEKKILHSKRELLNFLEIKENYLYGDFSKRYYTKDIPKKDGSLRRIKPPIKKVKSLQKKILNEILINYPIGECVYGLASDHGILNNAMRHQKNSENCLVSLDLKNFFPTISAKNVERAFRKMGFNADCARTLTLICTVENAVPQGAPTSPYISALVLSDLDKKIFDYCRKNKIIYTRYFDDLCLSGLKVTERNVRYIQRLVEKAGYSLHPDKKHFFKPDQEKIVNNVLIKKSYFDVTAEYKEKIIKAFKNFSLNKDEKSWRVFMGHIAFYLYINRSMALLFFKEVTGLSFTNKTKLWQTKA
jgi:RNA-directed DNA polymerase